MKSFLILATLVTLTACCNCMTKPVATSADTAVLAKSGLACQKAKVSGMECEACAETVSANLKKIAGVKDVKVDVATQEVKIFSDKKSDVQSKAVKAIVEKSGYKFNSLQTNCN